MSQDTRKDPRAKVLTMTVRYKSATLDEFIEHHSHDVSRGGMFIKTPSPFPPGTLLKFEVKIAEDKKVMQGVGRVVWKRESTDNDAERPSGMGVKFIKIDDESTKVIDTLVKGRGEGSAAFEAGESEGGGVAAKPSAAPAAKPSAAPATAAATPAAAAPVAAGKAPIADGPKRKSTMIGLGAVAASASTAPAKPSEPAPAAKEEPSFFPKTDSEKDMPPPEDRTVMKQAAELLKDALREAGGSMEEVGEAPAPEPKPSEKPAAKAPSEPPAAAKSEPPKAAAAPTEEKKPSVRPAPEPEPPPESRVEKKESVKPAASVRPAPAVVPEAQASGGGAGKAIALLAAVAVIAGAVFMFTREKAPETPVTPPPEPTAAATPEKTAEPKPEPTPVETATAAPTEEPAASAKPEPSAAPPAPKPPPVVAPKPPPVVAPKPPPVVAPKPPPVVAPPAPKPPPVVAPKPPPPPANTSDNPY